MKTIVEYVADSNDNFSSRPFCSVDSLVLSQLSYLQFEGLVPGSGDAAPPVSIAELAGSGPDDSLYSKISGQDNNQRLLQALVASPRFRDIRLSAYVSKTDQQAEEQFAAITCLLDDGTAFIAFRGTDTTFVGWKEDFNMAFICPVPAQAESVAYLDEAGGKASGNLRIGGHSKGGNLAIYAAVYCQPEIQDRVIDVYSHDGPGFRDELFICPQYQKIACRIHTSMPQSALIGMLLHHQENYDVIKSSRVGILQHDPFSWIIDEDDFHYVETVHNSSLLMNKTVNNWLETLDDDKRGLFIDTLYQVVTATDALTFYDLPDDWRKKAVAALTAIKSIDPDTRKFIRKTLVSLLLLPIKDFRDAQMENLQEVKDWIKDKVPGD
jgi:hypothetical protein